MNTKIKKIALSFAAIVFAGLTWYFFSQIFNSPSVLAGNALNWAMFVLCAGVTYGFLFLVALTRDKIDFFLTSLLSVLWILVFMGVGPRTLISAGALFVSGAALQEFPSALARSLNLKYYFTVYSKIALVILVLLGITSAYLQNRIADNVSQQNVTQQTSDFVWPYISKYIGQFDSEQSVNDYIREQYAQQGISNPTSAMIAQERRAMSEQVGFPINGSERMSDLGKRFLAGKLNSVLAQYNLQKSSLYIIFLSLMILWPIGRMLFGLIALLVYYIFRSTGMVKVVEQQITTKALEI